jgi:hypothetical protein
MVVDKFLFCLLWRMVHKSCTFIFCLEEWPLHDHPYSDVNIIYSVVQTGERTTDRGTNSAPNIKRLCNGEYRPGQLYMTNMHLIMWIENAFKFCSKLIHFYKERISFLFYCEDGKRGAVSWLSLKETTFSYQCGNKFIIRAHFSTYIYAYRVRNNASFIIINPITVDYIIFVGITAISWRPVCMSDEYASDNVNRKRF